MNDWIAYIKEHVNSDLWGFILLDYYHRRKAEGNKEPPSHLLNEVLHELPLERVDIIAFHNTLLSVCVYLLGIDFSEIMDKSVDLLKSKTNTLTEEQIESIISHYTIYGKQDVFRELLISRKFAVDQTSKLTKGEIKVHQKGPAQTQVSGLKTEAISLPNSEEFKQELPRVLSRSPFKHTHLLRYYSQTPDLSEKKPFKDKRVFFVLHFLKDLVPFVKAAERLGLEIEKSYFFYKDYPYPQREAMRKWLEGQHAVVQPRSRIRINLEELAEISSGSIEKLLIVEDGGFFVPAIHREFPQLVPHVIGAIEQTTRGIRNAEEVGELRLPVISVATSKLKSDYEPPYIARAVINNIRQMLPDITVSGKKTALYGCGTIGREIAQWLRANGADVTIFDPSPENKLWGIDRGFTFAESPIQAGQNKLFVIGASGNESITSEVIAGLSHGTYLLSASSELYEIDVEELQKQQIEMNPLHDESNRYIGTDFTLPPNNRIVHLLANGYPINFWGFESMPEEASDLILSLILLCAAELALGNYTVPGINSEAVNQIAKKYKVAEKFLEFHKQG